MKLDTSLVPRLDNCDWDGGQNTDLVHGLCLFGCACDGCLVVGAGGRPPDDEGGGGGYLEDRDFGELIRLIRDATAIAHGKYELYYRPILTRVDMFLPVLGPADLPSYLTRFQWDIAKYPIKQSLRNIADIISKQVGQIDSDLKTKSSAYNNLKGSLQNLEKKQTILWGSLLNFVILADLVKAEHFITDSEYLQTLLVIVPR
ncbi:hypothetical protein NQ317_006884 [Molorchus minor]|uniref:V-type proton ATPase subunit C n=1 Tax=Molorchus minor TaxID=1323400 RepID=A0ABQ9JL25_9CUCU|nr:hypothetical protein NQ317_006884 [Molorchus minor]